LAKCSLKRKGRRNRRGGKGKAPILFNKRKDRKEISTHTVGEDQIGGGKESDAKSYPVEWEREKVLSLINVEERRRPAAHLYRSAWAGGTDGAEKLGEKRGVFL